MLSRKRWVEEGNFGKKKKKKKVRRSYNYKSIIEEYKLILQVEVLKF